MRVTLEPMQQFRVRVYRSFVGRADCAMDLIDALASAPVVESPVVLSLSPAFRRQYSSIYDTLSHAKIDGGRLRETLYLYGKDRGLVLGGYEAYALDSTFHPRPDAVCVPERLRLRPGTEKAATSGHIYSHLVRLMDEGTSWCAPIDIERVSTAQTTNIVAREQLAVLDRQSDEAKAVVGDSSYAAKPFLEAVMASKTVSALVRVRTNTVLYAQAPVPPAGKRGRKKVHGERLKLSQVQLEPERCERLEGGLVVLGSWSGYHFKNLAKLVGTLVRVMVYRGDGALKYPKPLWLFWSGAADISLAQIYQLYRRRFTIEHYFRFLKSRLGLMRTRVRSLEREECWTWLCGLAYWQLLMSMALGYYQLRRWEREPKGEQVPTPGQVARDMAKVLVLMGTPACPARAAGKGTGRRQGYRPPPSQRYDLVRKATKRPKAA